MADGRVRRSGRPRGRRAANALTALGFVLVAAALALAAYNVCDERRAGEEAAAALGLVRQAEASQGASSSLPPADAPMPTELIDGALYVGVLRVPSLGLELPVLNEWSYEGLRRAPCRYAGSAYAGDLVIAGHNYATHFGGLRTLAYGAEVTFADMRGNVFSYEVASIETLPAAAVAQMTDSTWELTLFTCDFSGNNRLTIRCASAHEDTPRATGAPGSS